MELIKLCRIINIPYHDVAYMAMKVEDLTLSDFMLLASLANLTPCEMFELYRENCE